MKIVAVQQCDFFCAKIISHHWPTDSVENHSESSPESPIKHFTLQRDLCSPHKQEPHLERNLFPFLSFVGSHRWHFFPWFWCGLAVCLIMFLPNTLTVVCRRGLDMCASFLHNRSNKDRSRFVKNLVWACEENMSIPELYLNIKNPEKVPQWPPTWFPFGCLVVTKFI